MDAEWWERAKTTSRFYLRRDKNDMYEAVCRAQEKYGDVQSRQMIAVDQAIMEAHKMGIDWFAHIDIDECIYVPKMMENSARRYLGSKERSVEAVRLWNHEAVPEQMECQDWFRECTLFQMSKFHSLGFKPPREYDQLLRKKEGRELEPEKPNPDTRWWNDIMAKIHSKRCAVAQRLNMNLLDDKASDIADARSETPHSLFTSYEAGRSIARLDRHFPPPLPWGAYGFLGDSGDMLKECYQANQRNDAVVLHYPNASFSLWRQKYQVLGELPSDRGGGTEASTPRVHLASSQVVLHRDRKDQELFYKAFVMQNEYSELAFLAEHGLVARIEGVRQLLEHSDEPQEAAEQLPGRMEWLDAQSGLKLGR